MTELSALWLPILLGAVFVFFVSSIIHMGPFWHRKNYPQLPDENRARAAIGSLGVPPGDYMLPRCNSMAEMRSPDFMQKMAEGPVWLITVRPNGTAGYVAAFSLGAGDHYLAVFRVVGTTAFMAFSLGLMHDSIWYSRQWSTTLKLAFDGLIYALVLAGTFGWLWPKILM